MHNLFVKILHFHSKEAGTKFKSLYFLDLVMSVRKNQSKLECRQIRQLYFEIEIDFHSMTW